MLALRPAPLDELVELLVAALGEVVHLATSVAVHFEALQKQMVARQHLLGPVSREWNWTNRIMFKVDRQIASFFGFRFGHEGLCDKSVLALGG